MTHTTTYKGVEIEHREDKYWLYGKVFLSSMEDAELLIDSVLYAYEREIQRKEKLRKRVEY